MAKYDAIRFIGSNLLIFIAAETASAYGGGAPGYSNRYVGTFIWLDKLGLAAKHSLGVVVRQSIVKGYYALLNENYEPTPVRVIPTVFIEYFFDFNFVT